uniref:SH3 domain-containing protein n=1 Tax=Plectus sambesii TaxID=2011161 RepID=A0A914WJQ6_9BILA
MLSLVNRLQEKTKARQNKQRSKANNRLNKQDASAASNQPDVSGNDENDVAESADRRYGDSAALLQSESALPIDPPPMRNRNETEDEPLNQEQDGGEQRLPRTQENLEDDISDGSESEAANPPPRVPPRTAPPVSSEKPEQLFGIYVHSTDRLKTTLYIARLQVRVSLVDYETGQYLKRSSRYHTATLGQLDHLPERSTKWCNFRRQKLNYPVWNEFMHFQESFSHIMQPQMRPMAMFELVERAAESVGDAENTDQKIAWAFLKLIGGNNQFNCDKKLRLQLYRAPRKKKGEVASELEVFNWWKNLPKKKFTGTLYVTVKGVATTVRILTDPHNLNLPLPTNEDDLLAATIQDPVAASREKLDVPIWSRLPGQPCKVPNKLRKTVTTGKLGAITLRFSSDGCLLACASKESNTKFPIHILEFPSCRSRLILMGHLQLTYDLCWSKQSQSLLSASADCTARLWNVNTGMCSQVFPHTTFVYCAKFHPSDETIALTGAFDKIIRIWRTTTGIEGELLGELPGHADCINCMQLSSDEKRLFSGDAQGNVKVWKFVGEGECEPPYMTFVRHVRDDQLQGQMISSINVPPSNQFVAVQTRNGNIRLLDMRTNSLRFECSLPSSYTTNLNCRATMTPCGTFVFCGGPEGRVYAWWTEDGQKAAEFLDHLDAQLPMLCVEYHPLDHYLVFSQFGEGARLFAYEYNSSAPDIAQQPPTDRKVQVEEQADKQVSYTDFTIRTLLEQHRILAKLDSFERTALEAIEARAEKAESQSTFRPIVAGVKGQLQTSSDSPEMERGNTELDEYAAFEAAPDRETHSITGPIGQESIDNSAQPEQAEQSPTGLIFAKAIFNYKRSNDDELSFSKGETLEITSQDDAQWWIAKKGDFSGYVPANYLKIIDN